MKDDYRKHNLVCKTQITVFSFTAILNHGVHRVVFGSTWQTSGKAQRHTELQLKMKKRLLKRQIYCALTSISNEYMLWIK